MSQLSKEQFARVLPNKTKAKLNDQMMANINNLFDDPALRENYRDNLLAYTNVMKDGKYKVEDYLKAVQYVSYKLLGSSNIEAYTKTHPDRYQRLVDEGADEKTISSYCAAYNKTQLVNKIMEQTLVPTHVLNADLHQKALNAQAHLMMTAKSEKVRSDAANSLLTHLKMPETQKIELDVTQKGDKSIEDLKATTLELAEMQRKMIAGGAMNAGEVAKSKLLTQDGEIIEEN